jgi:hypothetical protein
MTTTARWIAWLFLPAMIFAQTPLDIRTITRTNNIQDTRTKPLVSWYQGEKVQYDLFIRSNTNAVYVPSTAVPIWYATDDTLTNYFLFWTGTVINAAGGHVRFVLPSEYSALTVKTYEAATVIYDGLPSNQPPRIVGDRLQARVLWSPHYSGIYRGPIANLTNYPLDSGTVVFPSFWSQYKPDILAQLNLDTNTITGIITNNTLTSNALVAAVGVESSLRVGLEAAVTSWQVKAQADLSYVSNLAETATSINSAQAANAIDLSNRIVTAQATGDLAYLVGTAGSNLAYTANTVAVSAQTTGTVAWTRILQVSNLAASALSAAQNVSTINTTLGMGTNRIAFDQGSLDIVYDKFAYWSIRSTLSGVTTHLMPTYGELQAGSMMSIIDTNGEVAYGPTRNAYALTNFSFFVVGSAIQIEQNETGAYWNVQNVATGSPVYVEADPKWTAVSNSIALGIITANTAVAIANAATTSAAVALSTANAATTTAGAAYTLAASAVPLNTPVGFNRSFPMTNELNYSIGAYDGSSPGYMVLSNAAVGFVYVNPWQGNSGDALIYDGTNKLWRAAPITYANNAGNADLLGGIPAASYLNVSSFQSTQTNYARFVSAALAPTGSTASGVNGEMRVDSTNLYLYIGRSNRWLRIPGSFSWP